MSGRDSVFARGLWERNSSEARFESPLRAADSSSRTRMRAIPRFFLLFSLKGRCHIAKGTSMGASAFSTSALATSSVSFRDPHSVSCRALTGVRSSKSSSLFDAERSTPYASLFLRFRCGSLRESARRCRFSATEQSRRSEGRVNETSLARSFPVAAKEKTSLATWTRPSHDRIRSNVGASSRSLSSGLEK